MALVSCKGLLGGESLRPDSDQRDEKQRPPQGEARSGEPKLGAETLHFSAIAGAVPSTQDENEKPYDRRGIDAERPGPRERPENGAVKRRVCFAKGAD